MDLFGNLLLGFETALSLQNLLYAFIGCLLGTLIGVLPGLGPLATISMLLPFTFGLDPTGGADHAGRHLLRRGLWRLDDGDPRQSAGRDLVGRDGASTATRWRGRAGPAWRSPRRRSARSSPAASARWSWPPSRRRSPAWRFRFGGAEYFSLMVRRPDRRGLAVLRLDPQGDRHDPDRHRPRPRRHRRQLGRAALHLRRAASLGRASTSSSSPSALFAFGEVVGSLEGTARTARPSPSHVGRLMPNREDFRRMTPAILRGTGDRQLARHPARRRAGRSPRSSPTAWRRRSRASAHMLGKGAIEGVAGAGGGEQRRGADGVHPDPDARHPGQRRPWR